MAGTAAMVELWGNVLSLVGNTISVLTVVILFDAFFPPFHCWIADWAAESRV